MGLHEIFLKKCLYLRDIKSRRLLSLISKCIHTNNAIAYRNYFFVHYPVCFLHRFIYVHFLKYEDFYINNCTHINSKYENYVQSGRWRWRGRTWRLAQEILVCLGFQEESGDNLYQIRCLMAKPWSTWWTWLVGAKSCESYVILKRTLKGELLYCIIS